jgi:hypothetical protein
MKMYRGIGRLVYRRVTLRRDRRLLAWLLSLKPGDIIGACTGLNHRVVSVEPIQSAFRNGWLISEVKVVDDQGRWHWAPGGGCVHQPYSRAEVLKLVQWCAADRSQDAGGWSNDEQRVWWQAMLDAETSGSPMLDEHGVYRGPPAPKETT